MVPRESKNNGYAKFGGTNKEYYGIFRNGLYTRLGEAGKTSNKLSIKLCFSNLNALCYFIQDSKVDFVRSLKNMFRMLYNLWWAIKFNQNEINIYFTTYLQSIQLKRKERKKWGISCKWWADLRKP